MTPESPKSSKVRPALHDHRKKNGARVPPLLGIMNELHEVDWRYGILPDLVWIALLVHKLGYRRAVETAVEFAVMTQSACHWELDRNPALINAYQGISDTDRHTVISGLRRAEILDGLRESLFPLVALYKSCPLSFVYPRRLRNAAPRKQLLATMREVVNQCLYRHERLPTLAQGGAVACMVMSRRLVGGRPFDFAALETYPDTEASLTEAARIRATASLIQAESHGEEWRRSFWSEGLRLSPCQVMKPREIHYKDIPLEYERDWMVALNVYFAEVRRLTQSELGRKPVPAYKPLREQVVNGLVARTFRTSIQILSYPCNWVFDTSEMLLRVVAELYVVARWLMERGQDDDFKRYVDFSAGQDKLYAEHIRVVLEKQGASAESVRATVESIINSGVERNPDLTAVHFGHWNNTDTRRMCADLGCQDLYSLIIAPAGWCMHGMYTSVLKENLETCVEPLHGLHRLPVFGRKPAISQLGVMNAAALVDDVLRRWIIYRGGSAPKAKRMPGCRFLKRVKLLGGIDGSCPS